MHKSFDTIEELMAELRADKRHTGPRAAQLNRYPLRFVLFENFGDFYEFASNVQGEGVQVRQMESWLPTRSDELMLTYSDIAARLSEYVKSTPADDYLLAPFSEMTRFLPQGEFWSLIRTIRAIEPPAASQAAAQRIYVPIIGMQNRMSGFFGDQHYIIWEFRQQQEHHNYRLVLSPSTYGVRGLDETVSQCRTMREWVRLWNEAESLRGTIVCTSRTIRQCADNAQPDNAFNYVKCENAYEFLKLGLGLDCGDITPTDEDLPMWERLAKGLDVRTFAIGQCGQGGQVNSAGAFAQAWAESKDEFARWLLRLTYLLQKRNDYLGRVLMRCRMTDLTDVAATLIFDESFDEASLADRRAIMARMGQPTQNAEAKMAARLRAIAAERGHAAAMRYMTATTASERQLMVEWLGRGDIERGDIKSLMPGLYAYTAPLALPLDEGKQWVEEYMAEYVRCKVANRPSDKLQELLAERNASPAAFDTWLNQFSTVKTVLYGREDIDVYYWVDGMGVDWIPLLRHIVERQSVNGVYLNEIMIARAELPTCTERNRIKLEELAGGKLQKIGDLDAFAHSHKAYPGSVADEIDLLTEAVGRVLQQYSGQKIAFVSDHGITYMAQHGGALALGGAQGDHHGRFAQWQGKAVADKAYVTLDDGKTICALTHNALTAKTPQGLGAHGGATPEEVLVPVVVVSAQRNASIYAVTLTNAVVMESDPRLTYRIKGLGSVDVPVVEYNGVEYSMAAVGGGQYRTERLPLVATCRVATLRIGKFQQTDAIEIKAAATENDMFGDLI